MSKNLSAKYYQENKERLEKKARERYQNLSKEEKEKKRQYGRECYKNLSEDEKNKLVEYGKKCRMRKNALFFFRRKSIRNFSFALMFEKKYKKFLIFRHCKFLLEI